MYLSLLTDPKSCPDSEIEDVVLCSMICEKLHQTFRAFSSFVSDSGVVGLGGLGFRVRHRIQKTLALHIGVLQKIRLEHRRNLAGKQLGGSPHLLILNLKPNLPNDLIAINSVEGFTVFRYQTQRGLTENKAPIPWFITMFPLRIGFLGAIHHFQACPCGGFLK